MYYSFQREIEGSLSVRGCHKASLGSNYERDCCFFSISHHSSKLQMIVRQWHPITQLPSCKPQVFFWPCPDIQQPQSIFNISQQSFWPYNSRSCDQIFWKEKWLTTIKKSKSKEGQICEHCLKKLGSQDMPLLSPEGSLVGEHSNSDPLLFQWTWNPTYPWIS